MQYQTLIDELANSLRCKPDDTQSDQGNPAHAGPTMIDPDRPDKLPMPVGVTLRFQPMETYGAIDRHAQLVDGVCDVCGEPAVASHLLLQVNRESIRLTYQCPQCGETHLLAGYIDKDLLHVARQPE